MNIADKIIEKMEGGGEGADGAPPGYFVDDLGFFVENDIRKDKVRYAEYILFRIRHLHNGIFSYGSRIYCDFKEIRARQSDILMLADSPLASVSLAQATWIYNRLRESVPEMSNRFICVSHDLIWDSDRCKIIKIGEEHG